MKFARVAFQGKSAIAVVEQDGASVRLLPATFTDMLAVIEAYPNFEAGAGTVVPLSEVEFLAPFGETGRNIFCVGKNYREHAIEFSKSGFEAGAVAGAEIDPYAAIFTKPRTTIVGPDASVDLYADVTQSVDYEAEVGVIIGKAGRGIKREDAYSHVFGYVIINDVTARDLQKQHKQWFMGKSLDGFCPMGPWIATSDEIEPENLEVKSWVNGELRQSANTQDLIFDIPSIIATLSQGMTLLPGDIIATGTPAGVGLGFNPPKFLRSGDRMSISITGLGTLSNSFV
ncbi:MAG TPA: fumarylacetoacetate hydrolase family protein [Devosiaceae bacterium]|jgi:2-keto-4-pentenoate hydratase/2-oxohepta-3-ene-1,7-dioic acid hydratase in catechol pathway